MRHTASILVGSGMKLLSKQLEEYVKKYGEADAPSYFTTIPWTHHDEDDSNEESTADKTLAIRHYFQKLHQTTVTINHPGDSNSMLLLLFLPLYDIEACQEAQQIVAATTEVNAHFTIMVVALTEDLGDMLEPELFNLLSAEEEQLMKDRQQTMLQQFTELKLQPNTLEQVVVMRNRNGENISLNLNQDSFVRIIGELSLLCVEKYNTIFTQMGTFDRQHPLTALGLSVMNLDKYYFEDYLLRRAYVNVLERERVADTEVDVNKVVNLTNRYLSKHQKLFSDFYQNKIEPLYRQGLSQEQIVERVSPTLKEELSEVTSDLTAFVNDPAYTLPEKQAILAVLLGYDDTMLKGNLYSDKQLSLDNLDEEVANFLININNACVRKEPIPNSKEYTIIPGPITVCADEEGMVALPIEELQKLRNEMRQSTNYIREKNKQLEEIEAMVHDAEESKKRITEDGTVVDEQLYQLDAEHEEVRFQETYTPMKVTERSVDLRPDFTRIKDQGKIGACTVFAIASIFEFILKKNDGTQPDLSESFVYYNVREKQGNKKKDTGSSFQDVIDSIGKKGICKEALHPYGKSIDEKPSANAYDDGKKRRIVKALNVNIEENDIKSAIQQGYPVAVSLKIYPSFHKTTGFVRTPSAAEKMSGKFGYHAMVVVGYTDETRHFVVRNSWGKKFGDGGYCYVPYSYICDSELNRMACIVTQISVNEGKTVEAGGGRTGKKQVVEFNSSDATIKKYVIENLLDDEQKKLKKMQLQDYKLKTRYETLMQTLGKQAMRREILDTYLGFEEEELKKKEERRRIINEEERPQMLREFDSNAWNYKIRLIAAAAMYFLSWIFIGFSFPSVLSFLLSPDAWLNFLYVLVPAAGLVFAWWYFDKKRRELTEELENRSALIAEVIYKKQMMLKEQKMKAYVAGMLIDNLLQLRTSLDKKYQNMKGYVGNLALWYQEEKARLSVMEPLVKDPFIPLLTNEQLTLYFQQNKEIITGNIHLYEYFKDFQLDEKAIANYKETLRENILQHIRRLLDEFTIFRHIFAIRNYPFLDKEYASAKKLLPLLDSKSVPFCLVEKHAGTKLQAHFLFVHTDGGEEQAWREAYPQYFNSTPISENIESVYKIIGVRMQPLSIQEVILD